MKELEFTVGFGFGGSGGGAFGFQQAETHLLGVRARFRHVGSFDHDEKACANYRYLTGHEETCIDARELTPAILRSIYGETAPDVFFASPPCQGASALLSEAKAATDHYQALNELAVVWTKLMLETWSPGPRVVLFENVPRIISRASKTIATVKALVKKAGYVWHDGTHELGNYAPGGHYDAGVLGGLAQHRARWIGIARDPKRCAPLVYKPPARRVRAVGEVLGPLPMPGDPAGGPMHALPRLSPMNWIRLAMIPAGGDWRDIPGVLAEGQERREVFRRHHLSAWTEPAPTVGGPGSNGPQAVADPRIQCAPHAGAYGVVDWSDSASTVTASLQVDNGRAAVADPRTTAFRDGYGVIPWGEPSGTVTGQARASNGAFAVADPRPQQGNTNMHHGKYRVEPWGSPIHTVTGADRVGSGAPSVADPRPSTGFDRAYSVLPWGESANTIAGASAVGCGAYSVADPRPKPTGAWLTLDEAKKLLVGPGPWAIVDKTIDGPPVAVITDLRKPSPIPILIVAEDGTWHRPLTVLELAVLQGLPAVHNGAPLQLTGPATTDREHIGNLVPAPAACAMAEQVLLALAQNAIGAFALSGAGGVWVDHDAEGLSS